MTSNCIIVLQRNIAENQFDHRPAQQNEQQRYQQAGHFKPVWQAGKANSHPPADRRRPARRQGREGSATAPSAFFVGLNKAFVHFLSLEDEESGIVPHGIDEEREKEKAGLPGLLLREQNYFSCKPSFSPDSGYWCHHVGNSRRS